MKTISLSQGKFTQVDDADYEFLNQWKWNVANVKGKLYAERRLSVLCGAKIIRMHRVILDAINGELVDHIDGDGLNNTRENIRLCTHEQNQQNSKRPITNTSGFKGVSYDRGKWKAQISINNKTRYIGRFDTPEEAALAYDQKAAEHYKQFARLNEK